MTEFSELLSGIHGRGDTLHVEIGEDWRQGRTIYGGLAAALCLEAVLRTLPDLPPLRSAQFAFVGPASGALELRPAELRRGKSTVFAASELHGEAGLATRATFCFGAGRASPLSFAGIAAPPTKPPEDCIEFFRGAPPMLRFLQHIDGRFVSGGLPFSGAKQPDMTLWLRHRDPALTPSLVSLIALADAPPPAVLTMLDRPGGPISTMTWSIDMLSDEIATQDGWWLLRNAADLAAGGYASQTMTIWNAQGRPTMISRQNVAMFL